MGTQKTKIEVIKKNQNTQIPMGKLRQREN